MKIYTTDDALLVVDVQNDFCPGGALPVPEGDKVVPVINVLLRKSWLRIASRDWHPSDHCSFKEQGGLWPPHCVQKTAGSAFHPDLQAVSLDLIVSKGTDSKREAYSAFEGTDLLFFLQEKEIKRVFVTGLATDYCVKHTALDALQAGFETFLLSDAIRGVNIKEGDTEQAIEEVKERGGKTCLSSELE